jgi:hypothetical protein
MAEEQLVQHHADCVEVGFLREVPALRALFGRCVLRCADDSLAFARIQRSPNPEIGDSDQAVFVDEDVLRPDIAMQDALRMPGGQRVAQLHADIEDLFLGEAPDTAQQNRQVIAFDKLHRAERLAVDFTHVEDAANGRMRDLPRQPHFGEDPLAVLRSCADDLQRHRRLQHQVFGLPHLA